LLLKSWNSRWTSSWDGRLSRKRFMVRLGRCEGVVARAVPVRVGELKALPVLEDEKESSDSERLRFKNIMIRLALEEGNYGWLFR
jgi:hypothetical protein